jgi:hypothetical protein
MTPRSLATSIMPAFMRRKTDVGQQQSRGDDPHPRRRAALSMIASALCMSLMNLLVKVVDERIPTAEVVLARSLLGVMLNLWLLQQAGVSP